MKCVWLFLLVAAACAVEPFGIQVLDETTGRGIPLVELETTDGQLFLTDSSGRVAFAEPGLLGARVFFTVRSHGYEMPKDGFGMRGVAFDTVPGGRGTVKLKRLNIAERVARLTGRGIYRDSILLGEKPPLAEPLLAGGVVGQDSAQAAIYRGRWLWFWGDTSQAAYPLGNFRTSGAVATRAKPGFDYRYFTDAKGFSRPMVSLAEKEGVAWIDGLAVVRDEAGEEKLVARFERRRGLAARLEQGILVWNDRTETFAAAAPRANEEAWRFLQGQATPVREDGVDYIYCGIELLHVRVPATLRAVLDPAAYEAWTCLAPDGQPRRRPDGRLDYAWRKDAAPVTASTEAEWLKKGLIQASECHFSPEDRATKERLRYGAGSVRWNTYRQRWISIAGQSGGKPSFLGEIWYAEAPSPVGPWTHAVKIVTHDRYTFYNPVQHTFLDEDGGRVIYFEGTYTREFSGSEKTTPLYNYNQILYRLDLADERLKAAH